MNPLKIQMNDTTKREIGGENNLGIPTPTSTNFYLDLELDP